MTAQPPSLDEFDAIPDLSGRALTVRGPVDPALLGAALMHEHLFCDLRRPGAILRPGEDQPEAHEPLGIANLARTRGGRPNFDNDAIGDLELVIEEAAAFAAAGGGTIVDVTGPRMGREPEKLRALSEATGLHVVQGGGYYTAAFHPIDMATREVDSLAAEIVSDVVRGAAGSGIRTGIIGEIAAEETPVSAAEWKSVRASALASRLTGAPISFHVGGNGDDKLRVIDACLEQGVAPQSIVMGHSGELARDAALADRVLSRGVFIEFDYLSAPGSPGGYLDLVSDHRIAAAVADLVQRGYAEQLLLGHDICQKFQLTRYGGTGYAYISRHFLPALLRLGVPAGAVEAIMVRNPARALAFAAPQPR